MAKAKENKPEMVTQSAVLEMGWTKTLIERYLPKPILRENYYYKCAAPVKLFEKAVVLKIMETDEVKAALEKAKKRKGSAQKGVETKAKALKEEMLEVARTMHILIIPDDELIQKTIKAKQNWYNYNAMRRHCYYDYDTAIYDDDEYDTAIYDVDENTLNRWVVNYIRHNLVSYDEELHNVKGKVGILKSYPLFKSEILRRIAEAYPKYADECNRQIRDNCYLSA